MRWHRRPQGPPLAPKPGAAPAATRTPARAPATARTPGRSESGSPGRNRPPAGRSCVGPNPAAERNWLPWSERLRAWDVQSGGGSGLLERHLGRCALGLCGFEQRRLLEAEHAGHLDGREDLAPDVVVGGGVVERLPGEGDLVLGRAQLLLQGEHVLIGL